jgi:hypothetical protein
MRGWVVVGGRALSSGRHTCVAETLFSELLTLFPTPDDRPTVLAGLPVTVSVWPSVISLARSGETQKTLLLQMIM